MSRAREIGIALGAAGLGAALTLFAAGRPWAEGTAEQGSLRSPLTVTGTDLAPAVPACAVAALAGALAVLATRGWARRVAGVCLAGCGFAIAVVAAAESDPGRSELGARAGEALGSASAIAEGGATGWGWVAVLGGLLVAVAGGLATWRGPGWAVMSQRYDAPAGGAAPPAPDVTEPAALDQWQALDRGEDPTLR